MDPNHIGFLCGSSPEVARSNETFDVSICGYDTALVFLPAGYAALVCLPYLFYLSQWKGSWHAPAEIAASASSDADAALEMLRSPRARLVAMFKVLFAFIFFIIHLIEIIYSMDLVTVERLAIHHVLIRIFIMLVTSITILLTCFLERKKAVGTSIVMFLFWVVALIYYGFRFSSGIRQEWYAANPFRVFFAFTCVAVLISFMQSVIYGFIGTPSARTSSLIVREEDGLGEGTKDVLVVEEHRHADNEVGIKVVAHAPPPELFASAASLLTYWWITNLMVKGWRRPVKLTDLWSPLFSERSVVVYSCFKSAWQHCVDAADKKARKQLEAMRNKSNPPQPPPVAAPPTIAEEVEALDNTSRPLLSASPDQASSPRRSRQIVPAPQLTLVCAIMRAFGPTFAFAGILKLLQDISLLVTPVFMRELTSFIMHKHDRPLWHGYALTIGLLLVLFAQTAFLQQYFQRVVTSGQRVRAALTVAVYEKCLLLTTGARQRTGGKAVNLISVDANQFMESAMFLHTFWSAPLQIIVALVLLWRELGVASLAALGIMLLTVVISGVVARFSKRFQQEKMKKKDERIKLTNEMLQGMKAIKLYAWEESFEAKISKARKAEISALKKSVILNCVSGVIWAAVPHLTALVTFAVYIFSDPEQNLGPVTVFVSAVLFQILRFPLIILPMVIANTIQLMVSMKRIAGYLLEDEMDPKAVERQAGSFGGIMVRISSGTFSWTDDSEKKDTKKKEKKKKKTQDKSKSGENSNKEENQPPQQSFMLHSINFEVPNGQLVAVVGKVGAGKSSLLSAILGEMTKLEGNVLLGGRVAFVPQQAWIQNATLKQNILFATPENVDFYKRVLDACALTPDLSILPGGDATEIGEKGINLSGGQKQRVNLARAVYSEADVFLLDDPLSAVDTYTARHLFDEVIGPTGMLGSGPRAKTRLWVTHRLNFLPSCDSIIVMDEGRIVASGTFKELLAHNTLFADLVRSYVQSDNADAADISDLETAMSTIGSSADVKAVANEARRRKSASTSSGGVKANGTDRQNSTKEATPTKEASANKKKLTDAETLKEGTVSLAVFAAYARSIGVILTIFFISASITSHVFGLAGQFWLSEWSKGVERNATAALEEKHANFAVYSALFCGTTAIAVLGTLSLALATLRAAMRMHNKLLSSIIRTSLSFFEKTPLGRIVNRFSGDVTILDQSMRDTIGSFMATCFYCVSTFIAISIKLPIFLALGIPLLVLYFIVQRVFVTTMRQVKRVESATRSPILSHFGETVSGTSTIRAYDRQADFTTKFIGYLDENQLCLYYTAMANRWLSVRMEVIGTLMVFATAIFAIAQRETLEAGDLGLALSYALGVSQVLNWMVRQSAEIETNIVAVERISEYYDTDKEKAWDIKDDGVSSRKDWPPNGEIKFDNVVLCYRAGLDPALRGISFTIRPHEKVGVVGRTGAGKSSLSVALLRIVELTSGQVTIDGVDVSKIGLHSLRRAITTIPQDSTLFSGTLRYNLDPFSQHSDAELTSAMEHAQLGHFLAEQQQGLDMKVSENGENLSAGQRQLVCMARALLRRPSEGHGLGKTHILLMDEATAAVDVATDRLITDMVRKEFASSTVLTIAHRLDTVIDYDRILVLDEGRVAEYDTPANLLADKESVFYGMAKAAMLVD